MNVDAEGRVWMRNSMLCHGEKLACWQKACSNCANVFVHVDQVALDPVCKLSELLWNELSGHSGWYDRRCPRWRAGDVVPAVSLQWTLLVRQLQLVLSVETVSSCSREVETTYHWLCWCLFRRASSRCDARCWSGCRCCWTLIAKSLFVEFSRCWCWLMFLIEGCERW